MIYVINLLKIFATNTRINFSDICYWQAVFLVLLKSFIYFEIMAVVRERYR